MFMTPRGLKIRIDIPIGFSLLARLWKQDSSIDAFRVLKTVEGLEHIPSIIGFVGALIALLNNTLWWHVAIGFVAGNIIGKLFIMFGVFIIPGQIKLATLWSWISGYGLLTIVGIILAWVLRGWIFAAAWIGGVIIAYISNWFIDLYRMKYYKNKLGVPFSQSEINFFNSYRLYAERLKLSTSINVTENEIQSGEWQQCIEDYATKYPKAVARFYNN